MTTLPSPTTQEFQHFMLTNRIYQDRVCLRLFKANGRRKVKGIQAGYAWARADCIATRYERLKAAAVRVAEREQRQRQQVIILRQYAQQLMLGAAVDAAYAPMLAPQQSHEAATITALADATRAARSEVRR